MRYVVATLSTIAVLTSAPAFAQFGGAGSAHKTPLQLQYEAERLQQEENEKAYNATMKRLKSQAPKTTSNDPWRGVRPGTESTGKK